MKRFLVYFLPNKVLDFNQKNSAINPESKLRCEVCNYIGKPSLEMPSIYKWRIFLYKIPGYNFLGKTLLDYDYKYNYYEQIGHYYCPKCLNEFSDNNLDTSDNIRKLSKANQNNFLRSILLILVVILFIFFLKSL